MSDIERVSVAIYEALKRSDSARFIGPYQSERWVTPSTILEGKFNLEDVALAAIEAIGPK